MVAGTPPARRVWPAAVWILCLLAGLLFATSARTARGTDLRAGRRGQLTDLIADRERQAAALTNTAAALRAEVDAATRSAAASDLRVSAAQEVADRLALPAGLAPVTGPGLEVTLDDAPRAGGDLARQSKAQPDDLVVHEQDVHAVLNALWAGGAEAVTVMGQRVIGTSAVRCVGNTLLLHGAVYSPPFVIAAIGEADRLESSLNASPGVALFRTYVDDFGLGYRLTRRADLPMPGYDATVELGHARAVEGG